VEEANDLLQEIPDCDYIGALGVRLTDSLLILPEAPLHRLF
jgi:hypothetical protein